MTTFTVVLPDNRVLLRAAFFVSAGVTLGAIFAISATASVAMIFKAILKVAGA